MDTSGKIGGVHTGKVLLNSEFNYDNGCLKLIEFDSNKIFCGLSFYNPIHKYNLRIDYRKSDISNRYTTLPLMLHTIIQADEHMSSNYLQETFQKIKSYYMKLLV